MTKQRQLMEDICGSLTPLSSNASPNYDEMKSDEIKTTKKGETEYTIPFGNQISNSKFDGSSKIMEILSEIPDKKYNTNEVNQSISIKIYNINIEGNTLNNVGRDQQNANNNSSETDQTIKN